MFIYWLMFLIPAFAVLGSSARVWSNDRDLILRVVCFLFVFFIGLRFKVGGDWGAYSRMYDGEVGLSLSEGIQMVDPGYALLNWLMAYLDLSIYAVNFVCAAVVMTGVYYFCRRQPQPWMSFLIATPYMLIVVAMGYTRQSVAMGFELLALVALIDKRLMKFFILIACAAAFHKSAVLLLPLGVLSSTENKLWVYVSGAFMFLLLGNALLFEHSDALVENYVNQQMQSGGGEIRVAMIAIPSAIFLLFAKRLVPDENERKLWFWIAIFSLACVPLIGLASTAVDRTALYFLPIQMVVYPRIVNLFRNSSNRRLAMLVVVVVYGIAEGMLLTVAPYVSTYWVPYDNAAFFW